MKKKNNIKLLVAILALSMPQIVFAAQYIVCDNDKKIPYVFASMVSTFITIIKIAVPILLVISGMIAFFKVASSSNVDDEMKKAKSKLINSIIAAVIIFFVFSIVNFAVTLVAGTNNKFMRCVECFMNTDKCEIDEENKEQICPGIIGEEYDKDCNPINKPTSEQKPSQQTQNTQPSVKEENKIETKNGVTYIDGILVVNKTYALPSDYRPSNSADYQYCTTCLTPETMNAFNQMQADASALGLNLYISSGFRSYSYQEGLYNNYVAQDGKAAADTYSARPGHSEHQTGLAFDLNSIDDSFAYTAEGKWVADNCYKYGLILRYPSGKEQETGYKYESWHLRYVGNELAQKLYNNGNWITLEEHFNITSVYQ